MCAELVWQYGENGGGSVGKRIIGSDERSMRLKGKPQMQWIDIVKRVLNERGMSVKQGRIIEPD